MSAPEIDQTDHIRLSLPASGRHVGVARDTAAAVAARSGFDSREIEDVRLAVTELTGALVHANPRAVVNYEFAANRDEFVAAGAASVTARPMLTGLSERLLGAVVDRFDLWETNGFGHFRAIKHVSDGTS